MLLFLRQFMIHMCVCVCVCVVVVHWHCSAQLSMFNMEKRYRNKIIIFSQKSSGIPAEYVGAHLVSEVGCVVCWVSVLITVGSCNDKRNKEIRKSAPRILLNSNM